MSERQRQRKRERERDIFDDSLTNSVTDNFSLHLIGDGFKLCKIIKKNFGEKCAGVKKKSPKFKKRAGVRRKKLSPHFEKRAGVKKKKSEICEMCLT